MKTFIATLLLLTVLAALSSFVSLRDHHHAAQARESMFPKHPSGGWDQVVR